MRTDFLGITLFQPQDAVTRENFNTVINEIDTAARSLFWAENLLANSNFQVWQRGQGMDCASGKTYTADRWMCTVSGSLTNRVEPGNGGGVAVVLNQNALRFSQLVELTSALQAQILEVGALTLSFDCKADTALNGLSARIGGNAFSYDVSTQWSRKSFTLTSVNTITGQTLEAALLDCATGQFSSANIQFRHAKLEMATRFSSYVAKSYGEELCECLRYYERIGGDGNGPMGIGGQMAYSMKGYGMLWYYPKRAIPTVRFLAPHMYRFVSDEGQSRNVGVLKINNDMLSTSRAFYYSECYSYSTDSYTLNYLMAQSGKKAYVEVDSELY